MPTKELFVWHEALYTTTNSRFYFTETLDVRLLNDVIRPDILKRLAKSKIYKKGSQQIKANRVCTDISTIDGYPNYLVVRWLRTEVILENKRQKDIEKLIQKVVDEVLSDAFKWNASLIRGGANFSNFAAVNRKANELHVNWSTGQLPLVNR